MEEKEIVRELTFDSLFILTEMLDKMGAESLIDDIEDNLQKIDNEKLKETSKIKDEKMKKEMLKEYSERKKTYALKEILKFVLLRPHKARKEILELVSEFNGISIEEAKEKGFKWVVESLKDMFKSGIWDAIKDLIGKEKIDGLKKTL